MHISSEVAIFPFPHTRMKFSLSGLSLGILVHRMWRLGRSYSPRCVSQLLYASWAFLHNHEEGVFNECGAIWPGTLVWTGSRTSVTPEGPQTHNTYHTIQFHLSLQFYGCLQDVSISRGVGPFLKVSALLP